MSVPGGFATPVTINFQLVAQVTNPPVGFSFYYPPTVLSDPVIRIGSGVPAESSIATNTTLPGQIGIRIDSTNTYSTGTRNIASVTFTFRGNAPVGTYQIAFTSVPTPQSVSNAAGVLLPTIYDPGYVIVGATAAGVDLSGRVLTPDGRGIRNAIVVVTDTNGNSRIATTSSFGQYRFTDIEAGRTYTIGVNSKRDRFTPRVLQIVDTLADFDFVGQQ
ncbi:MAG: carboxypeptidase regulatory-like domain-containing protein [Acidobacteria bacterium]|nr:carboxypeptidase regulatory-like domain-containing protein [Acidobacteriota bacterium]